MILKLKYISIILISIGLVLRTYHFSIGPVNGATLITLGVIALSIYCISKIINSDTYLLKVKFLSIMIMSIGGLFLIQSFQMYGLNGTMIVTLGLLPLLIYCIAKIIGKQIKYLSLTYLRGLEIAELKEEDIPMVQVI